MRSISPEITTCRPSTWLRYREATAGRLPVSSLVIPIQTGERTLGVLLLDNFNTRGCLYQR